MTDDEGITVTGVTEVPTANNADAEMAEVESKALVSALHRVVRASLEDKDEMTIKASVIGNAVTSVLAAAGEEFGPLQVELIEQVLSVVLDMGRRVDIQ